MTHFKKLSALTSAIMLISVSALTIGCSGGGGSSAGSSVGEQNFDESVDLQKLESEMDQVDLSMKQLSTKMNALSILNLTTQGDGGKKLAQEFKSIVTQLLASVASVRTQADILKVQFVDRLAQLDPNNPKHAEIIARLEQALGYLDQVEGYIHQAVDKVVGAVDSVILKVDGLVASIAPSNPLSIIAGLVWQTVKVETISVRNELVI